MYIYTYIYLIYILPKMEERESLLLDIPLRGISRSKLLMTEVEGSILAYTDFTMVHIIYKGVPSH